MQRAKRKAQSGGRSAEGGNIQHPTTNIQCPDATRKGQGRKSGGSRRESAQIDSPNLIVDSGKPACLSAMIKQTKDKN